MKTYGTTDTRIQLTDPLDTSSKKNKSHLNGSDKKTNNLAFSILFASLLFAGMFGVSAVITENQLRYRDYADNKIKTYSNQSLGQVYPFLLLAIAGAFSLGVLRGSNKK